MIHHLSGRTGAWRPWPRTRWPTRRPRRPGPSLIPAQPTGMEVLQRTVRAAPATSGRTVWLVKPALGGSEAEDHRAWPPGLVAPDRTPGPVSYTHLRAHETDSY